MPTLSPLSTVEIINCSTLVCNSTQPHQLDNSLSANNYVQADTKHTRFFLGSDEYHPVLLQHSCNLGGLYKCLDLPTNFEATDNCQHHLATVIYQTARNSVVAHQWQDVKSHHENLCHPSVLQIYSPLHIYKSVMYNCFTAIRKYH